MSLLDIQQLDVSLATAEQHARVVRDLTLSVAEGETVAIVGESGSGKTVTALAVMRLLEYAVPARTAGTVSLAGTRISALSGSELRRFRADRMGMIFQEGLDSLNPLQRVREQLVEAHLHRHRHTPPGQPSGGRRAVEAQALAKATRLLTEVGLTDTERVLALYPHQMSGGMQQRVMIAMALMSDPDLLIADEPTTALDVTTQAEILNLVRRIQKEHRMACIFITHDMAVAAEISDRIGVMYAGCLVELGPSRDVLTRPGHRYTRALLSCVPRSEVFHLTQLASIPGGVPGPSEELPGCRFAPRCGAALEVCRTRPPALVPLTGTQSEAACWNPATEPVQLGTTTESAAQHVGGEPLITVTDLHKTFQAGGRKKLGNLFARGPETVAADEIDLTVYRGEFFGLVGESGSGKTTLGRMLAGLERPTSGSIALQVDGRRLEPDGSRDFRRHVQFVFQDPQGSLDPRQTIGDIVAEPLRELRGLRGADLAQRVSSLLGEVGLSPEHAGRFPSQLSGGQRQRVAIARALAPEPALIVADEPTSALDVSVQGQVMNLLLRLRSDHDISFVFITHNLSLITSVADRVAVMRKGRLLELGPSEDIVHNPRHEYTQRLLAANPTLDVILTTSH